MSINQTLLYDKLQSLTQRPDARDEFIFGFLEAYGLAKSTITQIKNGSARNIAKIKGDVALKGQLYFRPLAIGENVHETAEQLKNHEFTRTHKIRFIIVTDFNEFFAYDLKADESMDTAFTELQQQYSFFLPLSGLEKSYTHSESVADVKAAERMGRLFDLIRERNQIATAEDAHRLNVFLTRLLFCFFAEDTDIFLKNQFTNAIKSTTQENGDDVADFLGKLFAVLNQPEDSDMRRIMPAHLRAFPYVNGGLFAQQTSVPAFSPKSRRLLLECGTLDWSQINPDIFGSMFQAVIDEEQRSSLGQHYTSVSNIIKVIKPLFLDKLYAELERSRASEKRLQALLERVTKLKIFDPACGSGNFLIIAYKELRRFEMEVFRALNAVSKQNVLFMSGIKLSQFYGIEVDDFAHEIALLSLWLAETQMHAEFRAAFGHAEPMLPLKSTGAIVLGNSLQLDWNIVCTNDAESEVYVIGNPPYLGRGARTDDQLGEMEQVFQGFKSFKTVDYVGAWLWIGANYIKDSHAEIAFLTTNSICQGEQVDILWPKIFERGIRIHFAYQSFPWKNGARNNAGVHVAVLGLSASASSAKLFQRIGGEWLERTVTNISPYLIEGDNLAVTSRNSPLSGTSPMYFGSMARDGGNLFLDPFEKESLLKSEPAAEKWLRRACGSDEYIKGKERWCLWLEGISSEELVSLPVISARLELVRKMRAASTAASTREYAKKPYLFVQNAQPRSGSYIIVPQVSSERREYVPMGMADASTVATNLVNIIPNGTLYEFGILNSTMHMEWLRTVGGRLKSDYRYSASLVYNTFPWPDAPDVQRKQIELLAEDILMARENYPSKSLAFLYDPDTMPDDLRAAHKALDEGVERLYRPRPFRDAADRLEHLFARYQTLVQKEKQHQLAEATAQKARKLRAA